MQFINLTALLLLLLSTVACSTAELSNRNEYKKFHNQYERFDGHFER